MLCILLYSMICRSTSSKHNRLTPTDHSHRKSPASRKSPKHPRSSPSNGYTTSNKHSYCTNNHDATENGFHDNGDKSDDGPFRKRTSSGKPYTC